MVGTHAVIQEQVQFHNLALAVIDEQHRFGVAQRLALRSKLAHAGLEPHLLMMSATPIPRTLAMSYYADLDVSVIDALPPGRTPIVTRVLPDSRKDELIERLAAQLAQGRQVYWVCPLIEESETLDLSNATATHAELSEALPGVLVGLLHSRMSAAEKKAVMQMFASGQMGLLVAIISDLQESGVGFRSITESLDTTSTGGRLVFHIFAALAEFERSLIQERTKAGLSAARARGRQGGRRPKLSNKDAQKALAMLSDPGITKAEVAAHFGVTRPTLNAAIAKLGGS